MRVAWLMLDGVGVAFANALNPLCTPKTPILGQIGVLSGEQSNFKTSQKSIPKSKHAILESIADTPTLIRAIDACLGVPGLPQSGTGQTSLLSGQNAAQKMGRHYGPWPGPSLRPLLEDSLPVRIAAQGASVRLVNHYPSQYLERLKNGKLKLGAIATAATLAGASLEPVDANDTRIPPPFGQPDHLSNTSLEQVERWGSGFVRSNTDLTVFDSWWSDHLGHLGAAEPSLERDQAMQQALEHAERLEAFLCGALRSRPNDTLLLLTSDHGNFENMGLKTHTHAPVPLFAVGPAASEFANITDLTGVAPALERVFGIR